MLVLLALLGASALAQEAPETFSVDVERFRPHMDTYGYGVTEGATTLGHLEVGVGLWGTYEEDSVTLVDDGRRTLGSDEDGDAIIDLRANADLQVGVGFGNRFSVAFDVPVVLWQKGTSLEYLLDPTADDDLIGASVGDPRGQLKLTLVDMELDDSPVGLAILARGSAPLGPTGSLIGEGAPTALTMMILEFADKPVRSGEYVFRLSLNGGMRFREQDRYRELVVDDEVVFAAGLGLRPAKMLELGVEAHGAYGGQLYANQPLEIAPFFTLRPSRDITLTAGGSIGLLPGLGTPDARAFVGGTISPSFDPRVRDRDHDGIVDRRDACLYVPEDLDGVEDYDGCPEEDVDNDGILDQDDQCPTVPEDLDRWEDEDGCPELDNDDDGFLDPDDACPNQPETVNGYKDDDGCPDDGTDTDGDGIIDPEDSCPTKPEDFDGFRDEDGCPEADNDRDGYLDREDACPDHAEIFNGYKDEDGCPDSADDSDGDGILDDVDRCPDQPEDFDDWEDDDGCPDPDNDRDTILDVDDACPDRPEVFNDFMDDDGCPDEAPKRVKVERTRIVIDESIYFDVDKATIKPESFGLLDEIAETLNAHPELLQIRIEGHTDSDGDALYNLKLSQARAESVVDALVERGVDEDRLEPVGFGEAQPLASNSDAAGKARNRRVEFHIEVREGESPVRSGEE